MVTHMLNLCTLIATLAASHALHRNSQACKVLEMTCLGWNASHTNNVFMQWFQRNRNARLRLLSIADKHKLNFFSSICRALNEFPIGLGTAVLREKITGLFKVTSFKLYTLDPLGWSIPRRGYSAPCSPGLPGTVILSTLSTENALSRILSGIFLEQRQTCRVLRVRFTVHDLSLILINLSL